VHLSYVSTHYLNDHVDAIDDTDVAYTVDIDFCRELVTCNAHTETFQ